MSILDKDGSVVKLAISDHLDWGNEYEHLIMLQEKINLYLGFIESGEIYESYPQAEGKKVEIVICAMYDLSEKAEAILNFACIKSNKCKSKIKI